jgi:hypothetical protein
MTDDSDPSKQELLDRVEQLESTVEKMLPSRRQALKLGAAGAASVGGVSLLSNSADASTGSAGQIGDAQNRPDIFADTLDANQLTGISTGGALTRTRVSLSAGSIDTVIPFDTIEYDPDSNYLTNNAEYVAPAAGAYYIHAKVRRSSDPTKLLIDIRKNGNTIARSEANNQNAGNDSSHSITAVPELDAGDGIRIFNVSSTNLEGNNINTYFEILRLA